MLSACKYLTDKSVSQFVARQSDKKVLIKSDILEKFMEVNEGKNLRDKGDVKAVTRKSAV